jgi:heavy metal efflux system protein
LILAGAFLLFGWGAISFHQLPVEAYPDVADNYLEITTQWPGISAEQIEQQVTIPLETVMNGVPHVVSSPLVLSLRTVGLEADFR